LQYGGEGWPKSFNKFCRKGGGKKEKGKLKSQKKFRFREGKVKKMDERNKMKGQSTQGGSV